MKNTAEKSFKIVFDGQLHQVDVNTLISSLVNFSTILQEINSEINSGSKIDVKIRALAKGSFKIDHVLSFPESKEGEIPIMNSEQIKMKLDNIVEITKDLLELKKEFKGEIIEGTEQEDTIQILTDKGDIKFVNKTSIKIYNSNQEVQNAITNQFKALENEPAIEDFEIRDEKDEILLKIEKDKFKDMSSKVDILTDRERKLTIKASLVVFKIVVEKGYQWEFFFKGNRIKAYISDDTFFKRIDNGQPFAKGDRLEVQLEITQVFDETLNAFINKSFEVKKVENHIPRSKQLDMNFNEDY